MVEFTPIDIFWILITVAAVFAVIGFVFKGILKFALAISVISLIFGIGFGWVPNQLEKVKNGEKTMNEVVGEANNAISEKIEEGTIYIEENKDGVIESFVSAWEKVFSIVKDSHEPIKESQPIE